MCVFCPPYVYVLTEKRMNRKRSEEFWLLALVDRVYKMSKDKNFPANRSVYIQCTTRLLFHLLFFFHVFRLRNLLASFMSDNTMDEY